MLIEKSDQRQKRQQINLPVFYPGFRDKTSLPVRIKVKAPLHSVIITGAVKHLWILGERFSYQSDQTIKRTLLTQDVFHPPESHNPHNLLSA